MKTSNKRQKMESYFSKLNANSYHLTDFGRTQKVQSRNRGGHQNKVGSRCFSTIFDNEPYRSMIERRQFRQCIQEHLNRINRIRHELGGEELSYSCVEKWLQGYLGGRGALADK